MALASYDPLRTVEALTDLTAADFFATQLNDVSLNGNRAQGALRAVDLTDAILDIIIETSAQGASILEVHVADPYWQLLTRYGDRPAFIDVDDSGLLIAVDVNFPQGTDMWWRLEAAAPDMDPTVPLVLTFEDKIVGQLRDVGGPLVGANNETRAAFIKRCVSKVPGIRFVCPALSQPPGSVGGDVTQGQINAQVNPTPASALNATAPAARRNPTKARGISKKKATSKPSNPDGLTPSELRVLQQPTNVLDSTPPDPSAISNAGFGAVP